MSAERDLEDFDQFEILSLINGQRKSQKTLILSLFLIIFFLIIGLVILAKKPPLVVRIDKMGQTDVVKNYHFETAKPSKEDVQHFVKRFLEDYIALKSNIVVRQFETSLNMMTKDLASQHLKTMKEQNLIAAIQASGIRNDVLIEKMSSEEVGDEIYIKVKARMKTRPLNDLTTPAKIKSILASLILNKVPRTPERPYALITKSIQIMIDKNGEQVEQNLGSMIHDS